MLYNQKTFRLRMYLFATIGFLVIMFIFAVTLLPMENLSHKIDADMENAYYDASSISYKNHDAINLNGIWNSHENIYINGKMLDEAETSVKLSNPTQISIPIYNPAQTTTNTSYQMEIKLNSNETGGGDSPLWADAIIAIPFVPSSTNVYLNGVLLAQSTYLENTSILSQEYAYFHLKNGYDSTRETQNLIISVTSSEEKITMHNRRILLASEETLASYIKMTHGRQSFLVGVAITVSLIGIIYIVLSPRFTTLTFMSWFDITLMLHLLFTVGTPTNHLANILSPGTFDNLMIRRLDLFFLFLSGYIGNILSALIFDKYNKAPAVFFKPMNRIFVSIAIYCFLFPLHVNTFAITFITVMLAVLLIGVLVRVEICYQDGLFDGYKVFHIIKTAWVSGVIYFDVVTLNKSDRPVILLVSAYGVFFLAHILVRAYEYTLPFKHIAELNKNLEKTVALRTKELSEANYALVELTIKDPLTQAFNRLYFEDKLSKLCLIYDEKPPNPPTVHVCMLDLDSFKNINDTYGHLAGDEQLVELVKTAKQILPEEVIFSRVGGEEFTILFVDKSDNEVLSYVEQLRQNLEDVSKANIERTTGSFGIVKGLENISNRSLLSTADKCLYYSKTHGKNKITINFNGEMTEYSTK